MTAYVAPCRDGFVIREHGKTFHVRTISGVHDMLAALGYRHLRGNPFIWRTS